MVKSKCRKAIVPSVVFAISRRFQFNFGVHISKELTAITLGNTKDAYTIIIGKTCLGTPNLFKPERTIWIINGISNLFINPSCKSTTLNVSQVTVTLKWFINVFIRQEFAADTFKGASHRSTNAR